MTKENAHLYLPLVQALAEGKTIQHRPWHAEIWADSEDLKFAAAPEHYRIKPEPVMVPLESDDVPIGSVFNEPTNVGKLGLSYVIPSQVASDSFVYATVSKGNLRVSWQEAMKKGWQIKRPGQDWQACSKIAE